MNKRNVVSGILTATLFLTVSAFAKATKETKEIAKKATEVVIKEIEGQVKWTGYGVGKSHGGTINVKAGEIKFVDDVVNQMKFTMDMNSLQSPDSEKLTGHLKNADFFDTQKFPEAQFVATEIKLIKQDKAKGPNYSIKGNLTIKDVTKPFEFKASVSNVGKTYLGLAETTIQDRNEFDIKYNSDKFKTLAELGDKLIKNNIDLQIQIKTK